MNTMNTLKDCLYQTVHRNEKPLKVIAEEIGMSPNYLTRSALPDQDESETGSGCNFPLKKFIPLLRTTKDLSMLDFIENSVGRVGIPVPHVVGTTDDVCRLAMQAVKEFGELMSTLDAGVADGRLSDQEISLLKKEGYEAVQAITSLLMRIENKTESESR